MVEKQTTSGDFQHLIQTIAQDVVEVHGHLPPLPLVLNLLHLLRGQQRHQSLGGEPNNETLKLIITSWPQQSRSLT